MTDKFKVLHDYSILVRRDMAPPLMCSRDGYDLVVRIGQDEEPVLKCYMCGGRTFPNEKMYEDIEKIVNERLK